MSRLHPVQALKGAVAMIRHVFKLIWNRKRTNFLMMTRDLRVVPRAVRRRRAWRLHAPTTGAGRSGFSIDRVWDVGDRHEAGQRRRLHRGAAGDGPTADAGAEGVPGDRAGRPARCWRRTSSGSSNSGYQWRGRHDRVRRRRGHRRLRGRAGPEDRRGPLVRPRGRRPELRRRSSSTRTMRRGPVRRPATGQLGPEHRRTASRIRRRGTTRRAVRTQRRIVGVVAAYREDGEFDGTSATT